MIPLVSTMTATALRSLGEADGVAVIDVTHWLATASMASACFMLVHRMPERRLGHQQSCREMIGFEFVRVGGDEARARNVNVGFQDLIDIPGKKCDPVHG